MEVKGQKIKKEYVVSFPKLFEENDEQSYTIETLGDYIKKYFKITGSDWESYFWGYRHHQRDFPNLPFDMFD